MKRSAHILRTALTAAFLCALLTIAASAAAYGTGTVTGDSLRLRAAASTSSSVLATVSRGTRVTVLEDRANGWYKVEYNGAVGYMSADYLAVTASALGTGTLNTDGASLNLRSGPGTSYSKVVSIPADAVLTITGQENGWYKTSYNGKDGYVCADYITLSSAEQAPAASNSATADSVHTGTLNTDGASLNLRSGPGTSYSKVVSIPADAALTITGEENGWYKTSYNGQAGYVSADYITITTAAASGAADSAANASDSAAANSTDRLGVLNTEGSSLNLRSGPGTGYDKVVSIPAGAILTITSQESGWYKTTYNGSTGYVCADYITLVASAEEASSAAAANAASAALAAQVIAYAKQFLGLPYVYGAEGPNSFDCSGFTQYVFKHFGYSLNRSAAGQYSNGTAVELSQIQPGDLILWRSYGSSKTATHVGIYIGNDQYIHASSTGKCITINDMDYGTNSRYIVGVRRILS